MIENALFRSERNKWLQEIQRKEKLCTYRTFKTDSKQELYLSHIKVHAHRSLIARLRGGTAPLAVELGRYHRPKVPREERLCSLCGVTVENEYHFLLECPVLSQCREKLFIIVSKVMPDFKTLPAHV